MRVHLAVLQRQLGVVVGVEDLRLGVGAIDLARSRRRLVVPTWAPILQALQVGDARGAVGRASPRW